MKNILFAVLMLGIISVLSFTIAAKALNYSQNTTLNATLNGTKNITVTSIASGIHTSLTLQESASLKKPLTINPATNKTILNQSYQLIKCKTDFVTEQVNDIIELPGYLSVLHLNRTKNLTVVLNAVEQGNAQLNLYASEGNYAAYSAYLHSNYDPALRRLVVAASRLRLRSSISGNSISALNASLINAEQNYQNCIFVPVTKIAVSKVQWYINITNRDWNETNKLAAKGLNVTNLTTTLNGAETDVIIPLQQGIANATNNTQIQKVLNSYCLYDGCQNGLDYHLAAKLAIGRINAVLMKIRNLSNNNSVQINQTELAEAQTSSNNATAVLDSTSNMHYLNNQSVMIWSNISAAQNMIKIIAKGKAK